MPEHASHLTAALYDQQSEEPDRRVADWGGDDLFTRMPRPPVVDDAPPPRFRPSLVVVDQPRDRRHAPAAIEPNDARDRRRAHSAEEAMLERAERLGLALVGEETPPGVESPPTQGTAAHESTGRRPTAAAARQSPGRRPAAAAAAHASERRPAAAAAAAAHASERRPAPTVAAEWHPTERRWDDDDRAPNGRRSKVITGRPDGAPRPLPLVPAARRRPARTPAEWIGPRPERIVGWAFALGLVLILIAISTADAATI